MVIVADSSGKELRSLNYSEFDFDIAENTSDFMVSISIPEWVEIPQDARIYIPDTEYGGIFKKIETDTKLQTISVGGYTWRGMLRNKIISPPDGEDYAIDSGDINDILRTRLEGAFSGLFTSSSPMGVTVNYQYKRYCTLEEGLTDMLESVGYKMRIKYNQALKKVVVDAVPIVNYADKVEFSSDMDANYLVRSDRCGVNHLICLGSGDLAERTVVHLYTDANGNISQSQTFYGSDEVVDVYDYAGADEALLIESGTQRLETLRTSDDFSLEIEGEDFSIGDIVGGKDYITGITMTAKVIGILHKSVGGIESTEYTISDVTVED